MQPTCLSSVVSHVPCCRVIPRALLLLDAHRQATHVSTIPPLPHRAIRASILSTHPSILSTHPSILSTHPSIHVRSLPMMSTRLSSCRSCLSSPSLLLQSGHLLPIPRSSSAGLAGTAKPSSCWPTRCVTLVKPLPIAAVSQSVCPPTRSPPKTFSFFCCTLCYSRA